MEDKPFRTIDQQIDLLEKRGVSFIDRDEARQFLATHGYYSVVNGYKSAFIDKNKSNRSVEVYREGIDFVHIEVLYLLDRSLRRSALSALLDAEDALRTAIVYAFCEKHRGRYDYLDPSCYCSCKNYKSKKDYASNLIKVLSALQAASSNRQHKKYIEHYIRKHGYVPLWVVAKCLTFGVMSNFYELQQPDIKQKACATISARSGSAVSPHRLQTAYKTLSGFRNICAHEERLYCARLGKNDERSFRDLVESLALVSTPEETSQFCMRIRSAIGLLSSKCIPEKIAEEVTGLMKIDAEYLDSKIIDTDHEEQ